MCKKFVIVIIQFYIYDFFLSQVCKMQMWKIHSFPPEKINHTCDEIDSPYLCVLTVK